MSSTAMIMSTLGVRSIPMFFNVESGSQSRMLQPAVSQCSLKAPHVIPAAVFQGPQEAPRAASLRVRLLLRRLKGSDLPAYTAAEVILWPCTCATASVSITPCPLTFLIVQRGALLVCRPVWVTSQARNPTDG